MAVPGHEADAPVAGQTVGADQHAAGGAVEAGGIAVAVGLPPRAEAMAPEHRAGMVGRNGNGRFAGTQVGTIAANLGHASQSSFNKVFEKRYGMTPSRFRHARDRWPDGSEEKAATTRVRQRYSPGFRLLGRRYTGLPCYVPEYWQDFIGRLPEGLGLARRHLFVGLLRDDMRFVPPDQVRYDCCVAVGEAFEDEAVASLWPGFFPLALPECTYASLDYRGYYLAASSSCGTQHIGDTYFWLLDTWLAQSRQRLGGDYVAEIHATPPVPGEEASCTILLPVIAA